MEVIRLKKLLSLALAAALALSLTACSGGGEKSGGDDKSSGNNSSLVGSSSSEGSQSKPVEEPDTSKAGPAFITASIGETVTLEGVDVELSTGEFTSGDKLGGNISVSTHSDSNQYFWLTGTMTNVGAETISSFSVDSIVNIVFDDTYTYSGDIHVRNDMGPFAESEVLFWADVPPAMLERYETVKVQFAYNDGFADYDWSTHSGERTLEGYDHQYEFIQGGNGGGAAGGNGTTSGSDAKTISTGDTIATNDYEFTLTNVELTYEVLPPNTSSVYSSYVAESGKVYIHVAADVKNTMQRDIRIDELFTASALYDGQYSYNGFTVVNDGDNRFDWAGSYVAATPLETCKAHSIIECPDEVNTSGKPITVSLDLGGTTYEYTLR